MAPLDQRVLEAILCAVVAQEGGELVLPAPAVSTARALYRLDPEPDGQGETLTLRLKMTPPPRPAERRQHRRWQRRLRRL